MASKKEFEGLDTPKPWGFINEDGRFVTLPKTPMLLSGMGPPPFNVTPPHGITRHVIEQPD